MKLSLLNIVNIACKNAKEQDSNYYYDMCLMVDILLRVVSDCML